MFKERFIKLCTERGISPSAVCNQIGLSNSVYSKWGENTIPRQTVLVKLSEFFGVSIAYLKGEEEDEIEHVMNVYNYVKVLADEKNLTIKEVEIACGLGNATIGKWKTSMPKADILFKVAQFLGESVEYFLTGNRSNNDPTEDIIITAYRQTNAAGKARIIQMILNERDDSQSQVHTIYRAANSPEHEEHRIEKRVSSDMDKLKNATTVTSEEDL